MKDQNVVMAQHLIPLAIESGSDGVGGVRSTGFWSLLLVATGRATTKGAVMTMVCSDESDSVDMSSDRVGDLAVW